MKQYTLQLEGMKCPMCESHINDQIREVKGTSKIKSSYHTNIASFVCDDNFDVNQVKANIEKQGYHVLNIRREEYVKKGFFSFLKK
jgi:copper chaperone CopZ